MGKLIVLVGPPGSGKTTAAKQFAEAGYVRVSTDDQGKDGQMYVFQDALYHGKNIVIDRMNFNKEQRNRYLLPAKAAGYATEIQVFHESRETCFDRCLARIYKEGHPTVTCEEHANKALHFFFSHYERVEDTEADIVVRHYPKGPKPLTVICDLDGTLCNTDHRQHFVEGDKKDWKSFFAGISDDRINEWCLHLLDSTNCKITLCSGRGANYRDVTAEWLEDHAVEYDHLFMREVGDFRKDSIVKENILDFEILTRYTPFFVIDDRKQVVEMWRKRGIVCLQCAEGNF